MTETLQNLVRGLLAAGVAPTEEGTSGLYLLNEEDGDLMQQLWTANGPGKQTCIASGVKGDSPALDLKVDNEHLVFFLDDLSTLACRRYDSEEDEWEEYHLSDVQGIKAHFKSRLAGCLTYDGGAIIVFQTPTNQLQAIVKKRGSWCKGETISATASPGTPLHAVSIRLEDSETVQLTYVGSENSIHRHVKHYSTGSWEDRVIENSKFEKPITHLAVVFGEKLQQFVLSDSELVLLDENGARTGLGNVVNKKLIPPTDAECCLGLLALGGFGVLGGMGALAGLGAFVGFGLSVGANLGMNATGNGRMNAGGYRGINTRGHNGVNAGGHSGVNAGGHSGVNAGGHSGVNAGGHSGVNAGGHSGVNAGGHSGVNAGGHSGVNDGGHYGMNASGHYGMGASGHYTMSASGHYTMSASGHYGMNPGSNGGMKTGGNGGMNSSGKYCTPAAQ